MWATHKPLQFKSGSYHLFRQVATLMLEKGANIRFIQQLLGHASINTNAIYTHVGNRFIFGSVLGFSE